jgi:SAM-dependent methyltransferase
VSSTHAHWARVYERKRPDEVSWYEPLPEASLRLIAGTEVSRDAPILDVGGGASGLAGALLAAGYADVTVADLSAGALAHARSDLGLRANEITWIECDVREHVFARTFDLWHDRAVFHFMVDADDRARYLQTLRRTLRPGGHLVLATFGPAGPERCSGLPVRRYSEAERRAVLGDSFSVVSHELRNHETPAGNSQQFLYIRARRVG